jgi:transcriptional regulator with XRE-family HTH domain
MPSILEPLVTFWQVLIVPAQAATFGYMQESSIKSSFSERLNELCDEHGLPPKGKGRQVAVAKMFNLSQKGARKWLEGEGLPTLERTIEIASRFGVQTEWLLTGRGDKYITETGESMLASLPPDIRIETANYIGYRINDILQGERLARYLRWIDSLKRPPGGES